MLGGPDLRRFLESHKLDAEVIDLPVHTPTVEDAARAVSTIPERIVKTLLFLVDGEPVLAIACGTAKVDRRPIAAHFGVGRKRVKLADPETVLAVTGYQVGSVPPFGHLQDLPTLIDRQVKSHPLVYAGGGEINALLRVSPGDISRLTGAVEIDLVQQPDSSNE